MLKVKSYRSKLEQSIHNHHGQIRQLTQTIAKNKDELRSSRLRNIQSRFQSAQVEMKTTEMACADLAKYYEALEKALMRFHSIKMEEVNKIVNEYWQATYRGNDIDSIEIRAEHEERTGRSYNYRLVMKKDSCELDMRGRCSAGQRVLASLVIRLALAETFCLNCGILALDEPTTNLDEENVFSLAQALAKIIESRREQSHFQLVVISHDEDFVTQLARLAASESYYKITKDSHAFSRIERRNFLEQALR